MSGRVGERGASFRRQMSPAMMAGAERLALGALGIGGILILWEVSALADWLNPIIISSPSRILVAFRKELTNGALIHNLAVSSVEFALGFGLSLLFGVLLGFAMGLSRIFEYCVDPFVWFIYSAPTIALYPILVVWFGFGFATVVAITVMLTFVSITVNTIAGVHSVDGQLVRAIRSLGGTRRHIVVKLILPAAASHILAGIRIGLGRALTGVTLGEMFGSSSGLGFSLTYYASHLKTDFVLVYFITLVIAGLLLYRISDFIDWRLQSWRRT